MPVPRLLQQAANLAVGRLGEVVVRRRRPHRTGRAGARTPRRSAIRSRSSTVSGGATGRATVIVRGSRRRSAATAACIVAPVATPSSTTITVRSRTVGGIPDRPRLRSRSFELVGCLAARRFELSIADPEVRDQRRRSGSRRRRKRSLPSPAPRARARRSCARRSRRVRRRAPGPPRRPPGHHRAGAPARRRPVAVSGHVHRAAGRRGPARREPDRGTVEAGDPPYCATCVTGVGGPHGPAAARSVVADHSLRLPLRNPSRSSVT